MRWDFWLVWGQQLRCCYYCDIPRQSHGSEWWTWCGSNTRPSHYESDAGCRLSYKSFERFLPTNISFIVFKFYYDIPRQSYGSEWTWWESNPRPSPYKSDAYYRLSYTSFLRDFSLRILYYYIFKLFKHNPLHIPRFELRPPSSRVVTEMFLRLLCISEIVG